MLKQVVAYGYRFSTLANKSLAIDQTSQKKKSKQQNKPTIMAGKREGILRIPVS